MTMTAPPALSVPRYVLGALQDALAIEDELHAMLSRRQSKIPELHTALKALAPKGPRS